MLSIYLKKIYPVSVGKKFGYKRNNAEHAALKRISNLHIFIPRWWHLGLLVPNEFTGNIAMLSHKTKLSLKFEFCDISVKDMLKSGNIWLLEMHILSGEVKLQSSFLCKRKNYLPSIPFKTTVSKSMFRAPTLKKTSSLSNLTLFRYFVDQYIIRNAFYVVFANANFRLRHAKLASDTEVLQQ